jgi:hypothetical protein
MLDHTVNQRPFHDQFGDAMRGRLSASAIEIGENDQHPYPIQPPNM